MFIRITAVSFSGNVHSLALVPLSCVSIFLPSYRVPYLFACLRNRVQICTYIYRGIARQASITRIIIFELLLHLEPKGGIIYNACCEFWDFCRVFSLERGIRVETSLLVSFARKGIDPRARSHFSPFWFGIKTKNFSGNLVEYIAWLLNDSINGRISPCIKFCIAKNTRISC